jgi:hypothetical protein
MRDLRRLRNGIKLCIDEEPERHTITVPRADDVIGDGILGKFSSKCSRETRTGVRVSREDGARFVLAGVAVDGEETQRDSGARRCEGRR